MATAFLLTALAGFTPTYWAPAAVGRLHVNPVVHIHAVAFVAWVLLYQFQAALIGSGRVRRHRELGLLGVSLATALTLLGPLATLNALKSAEVTGAGAVAERLVITPLSSILAFALLTGLAFAYVNRPEWHRRLMLLSIVVIVDAPLARLTKLLADFASRLLHLGPPSVWLPSELSWAAADLFLLAALVQDQRARGRVHPVYLFGTVGILAMQALRRPISGTAAWDSLVTGFLGLAGSFPAVHG